MIFFFFFTPELVIKAHGGWWHTTMDEEKNELIKYHRHCTYTVLQRNGCNMAEHIICVLKDSGYK